MNSKNSDSKENECKAEDKPGRKEHQRNAVYGEATNLSDGWQAGATEYDVNYRGQDASSSKQNAVDKFGNSRKADSMGGRKSGSPW